MLREALREHFGHEDFRPGQEAVVQALVAGESALALFPTGAGKSLCYQLPALLREGTALVVSPLIALMTDQVDALRRRGVAAERFDSTLDAAKAAQVLDDLQAGRLKLLYVAPERLADAAFLARMKGVKWSLLAIDEAHCLSEWGHSFRPDYLRLARVAKRLRLKPVLALTATATPAVAKDIRAAFGIPARNHAQTSFHRPNLHLRLTPTTEGERFDLLAARLADDGARPAIVYVTRQETAEEVATRLTRGGRPAQAYHAGLPDDVRAAAQEAFMAGRSDVMVATIAFGMGVDKADIRAVFHWNLPKSPENLMQETGRAGRDGCPALCELFAVRRDRTVLENFVHGDTPAPAALEGLLQQLLRQPERFDVSRWELSQAWDVRLTIVELALAYLEMDGLIEPTHTYFARYRLTLARTIDDAVAGHPPARQRFLRKMLEAGKTGWRHVTVDVSAAAEALKTDAARVVEAIRWLEEAGEAAVKPTGARQAFRRLVPAAEVDVPSAVRAVSERFADRERRELARLDDVFALVEARGCLTQRLLRHFGEKGGPCGHCDRCLNGGRAPKWPRERDADGSGPADAVAVIQALRAEAHPALRGGRAAAKFLTGLTSPATLREKLTRHESFGRLAHVPFAEVLSTLEALGWR